MAQSKSPEEYLAMADSHLRYLSLEEREGIFAELKGLLFTADGSAHSSSSLSDEYVELKEKGQDAKQINVPFYSANSKALFVTSNGTLSNYRQIISANKAKPGGITKWKQVKLYIQLAGKDAVFAKFAEEIEAMEVARVVHFLKSMTDDVRAAFLAEMLGLVYCKDGSCPYVAGAHYTVIEEDKIPYSKLKKGTIFTTPYAQTFEFSVITNLRDASTMDKYYWTYSKLGIYRFGEEKVFKNFKPEITAMESQFRSKVR